MTTPTIGHLIDLLRTSAAAKRPVVITPGATFADLGIDGLARVELVMEIEERFKVDLPDEVFEHATTIESLAAAIAPRIPA